jgi:hypothetical protein
MRLVYRFRLSLPEGQGHAFAQTDQHREGARDQRVRRKAREPDDRQPRSFDPSKPPKPPEPGSVQTDPEAIAAKQEKAQTNHFLVLCRLSEHLERSGWSDITEIPAAIDLMARSSFGLHVIFEAKTIADGNELSQTRSGLAQLQEYRLEYGLPTDELCLVVDAPITVRRQRLLEGLGIGVLVVRDTGVAIGNTLAEHLLSTSHNAA